MEKTSNLKVFLNGLFKENPIFVMILGMCPTLAVTTKLESALGMGMSVIFVLFFSNLIISLIKKIVPANIRIPVYILIIATLVTVVEMVMNAFLPDLYAQLGIFVSLIVVNCIILGRAEAFASKNTPLSSIFDALGMGIGFTLAVSLVAICREFLGAGQITIWGDLVVDLSGFYEVLHITPAPIFSQNAGAFLTLGLLIGIITALTSLKQTKKVKGAK